MPPKRKAASRSPKRAATSKAPANRAGAAKGGERAKGGKGARGSKATKPPIVVLPPWTVDKGGKSISVEVKAKDFVEAVEIVNEVMMVAEELEHHPDVHIERWNHLRFVSYSHDVGKLTERDEELALRINEVLAKHGYAQDSLPDMYS